jgi:eukaryotic-like serine/threonine-protein kinase
VAKAASRLHTTENGQIKGKLSYMAPEQLRGADLDRRVDVFAAGIVLWELLAGQRLFARGDPGATVTAVLAGDVKPPSKFRPEVSPELDALVLKALAPTVEARFTSAREMAIALENCVPPASNLKVGAWVESVAGDSLKERAQRLREAEESTGINAVVDVEGLQKRLADARASMPARESDGRIPLRPIGETTTQPLRQSNWVRRERPSPWLVRGGVGALALVVLGLSLWAFLPSKAPEAANLKPSPSAQPVSSLAAASAAAAPVGVDPADIPQETQAPSATAPTSATPSTTHAVKKTAAKSHASANCVPPFVLDAQGRKRFKPECF